MINCGLSLILSLLGTAVETVVDVKGIDSMLEISVYVRGTSANEVDEAPEPVIVAEDEAATRYETVADERLDMTPVV